MVGDLNGWSGWESNVMQNNEKCSPDHGRNPKVKLDIEINMNNRPLTYLDDDTEWPIPTPNVSLHGQIINVPDIQFAEDNPDFRKWQLYLKRCKQAAWRQWSNDYLKALRERPNMKYKTWSVQIKESDVMLIKSSEKNRGRWKSVSWPISTMVKTT